jgi:signal transduction histidine kinase
MGTTQSLTVLILGMSALVLTQWLRSRRSHRVVTLPAWAYVTVVVVLGLTVTVSTQLPVSARSRIALTATTLNLAQVALLVIPVLERRRGWQVTHRLLTAPVAHAIDAEKDSDEHLRAAGLPGLRTTFATGAGRSQAPPVPHGRRRLPRHSRTRSRRAAALGMVAITVEALRLRELTSRQAAEIAMSRQRLVTTALEERRRIERDLHDGAQSTLYAVLTTIDNAESSLSTEFDAATTRELLRRAHERLTAAITDLRRLTRGR